MSLSNILDQYIQHDTKKQGLSEERLLSQLDNLRYMISFFRKYPDLLIDYMKGPDSTFQFYFYQRVFLRIVMRHRYVYATFPRAYSKSFLSMMALMLRCILYPGAQLFVTIEQICKLIPALSNQINWNRGVSKKSKDDVNYVFKNGSVINILAAKESSRGQRRTGRKNFYTSLVILKKCA